MTNIKSFYMQQREPFGGKIWLLADEGTASGAEAVTAMLKLNNLATIVGQPTRGMFGTTSDVGGTALSLPNTGIRFRIDTTLHKDRDGNILQGYGIQPHYYPREGMDALETVLVMIAEGLQ